MPCSYLPLNIEKPLPEKEPVAIVDFNVSVELFIPPFSDDPVTILNHLLSFLENFAFDGFAVDVVFFVLLQKFGLVGLLQNEGDLFLVDGQYWWFDWVPLFSRNFLKNQLFQVLVDLQ